MEGFYYLVMLIGVAWLCVWSIAPKQYRDSLWWPFDMPDDGGTEGSGAGRERPRRRDAAPPEPAPTPAADLQHALPKSRPAQSWRVRREQAQASRRERRG
jgi:hypothetical protein